MAAKKSTAKKTAAKPAKKTEPAPEAAPTPVPGYVTIERDGETATVDAKSVPELEVQGWKATKEPSDAR